MYRVTRKDLEGNPEWRIAAVDWPTNCVVIHKPYNFIMYGGRLMNKVKMYQVETIGM